MSPQINHHSDRGRSRGPLRSLRRGVALLALALVFPLQARADVKVGDPFPELTVNGVVLLAGAKLPPTKGAVVLVDFWASWCAPCKASFPALGKLHEDFSRRGLVLVAVGVDEKMSEAMAFVRKMSPSFVTLHDREQKIVKQVVVPTMPTSYLIGRDGRVRFVHEGYHGDATDKELRKEIETLLAENN
ncbi:MAG: TlpA family protein disulfide reductase [Opitutus sp.]|nr:TlpA family protein disulfide reductase [Opitutus sp.]